MNAVELSLTPSFRLDGKRALVTGAGRGLGVGFAAALAEAGAHVTLAARTADEIEAAAAAIRAARRQRRHAPSRCHGHCRRRADARCNRGFRHPREQCRHQPPKALRRCERRGLRRRDEFQCARGVLRGAGRGAPDDRRGARRVHHQRLLADGTCRRPEPHDLLRVQACAGGVDQGDGDRARAARDPRQHASGRPSSRRR